MKKIFNSTMQKAAGAGEVTAVFATLNIVDHDNDVTLPGAFGRQDVIIEAWNHGQTIPTGKGRIEEAGGEAVLHGRFFLDTTAGREHFAALKELGPLAQWSYTFDVKASRPGEFKGRRVRFLEKLEVIGVGPVTRGAGVGTRTISLKAQQPGLAAALAELEALEADPAVLRAELDALEPTDPAWVKAQLMALGGTDYARREIDAVAETVATSLVSQYAPHMSAGLASAWAAAAALQLEQEIRAGNPTHYDANPGELRAATRRALAMPV
jgi:hypothetical protein